MCSALCDTLNIFKFILNWLAHGLKCHFEKYKFNREKTPKQKKEKKKRFFSSSPTNSFPYPSKSAEPVF